MGKKLRHSAVLGAAFKEKTVICSPELAKLMYIFGRKCGPNIRSALKNAIKITFK
jgi:hypothetical protein